jgi:hypothetical protein
MNNTEIAIFNKYLEIKQDLISNLKDVWNRKLYYSKKYRGNEFTDINVGINETSEGNKILLIFVQNNKRWIRDELVFNSKEIISSSIKSNLSDE